MIILTKKESEKILSSKESLVKISLDLGVSQEEVTKDDKIVNIRNNKIQLDSLLKLEDDSCYSVENNKLKKIGFFSEETNLYYKLVPSIDFPTFTISSTPMHRHTNISPKKDTLLKIKEVSPIRGRVLDTCLGLGYTAIFSSKKAYEVHTFERDNAVIELTKVNPYSMGLYENKNIILHNEDVCFGIKNFKNEYFDEIIHDPPTFKLNPALYHPDFYKELYRVLKHRGVLYHYAPNPDKMKGRQFYNLIIKGLRNAGFCNIKYKETSSGVRAEKY